MLKSCIEFKNSKPYIRIGSSLNTAMAYTTYFEELGEYSDFIAAGYKIFFVNVSFTDLPINNTTGFSPFRKGVFEADKPDYSEFDFTVRKIVAECPDVFIFPRINIAMPRKWLDANPYETVPTPLGGNRESFCSDLFRRDGAKLLETLVEHIRSSDYADKIAGYQVCGGTTQEWMHHDMSGSYSELGLKKFALWLREKYGVENVPEIKKEDLTKPGYNEAVSRYYEFCGETAAKTVEHFAKELKSFIGGEQVVGAFYGYHAFVNDCLLGLHGLRFIIDSPYIDFFSSPCCYDASRQLGVDWGDMLSGESVRQHGKLYFVECDIRTHLTQPMQASRPGVYPEGIYLQFDEHGNKTVWKGPDTRNLSLSAIRKAYAHQLTKGNGIWWFDMWGGWYHDEEIMVELAEMKRIAEAATEKNTADYPRAKAVIFVDEKAYINNPRCTHFADSVSNTRVAAGNTGIPFDLCMVEDAEKVLGKYSAAVFTSAFPSESGKAAVALCEKMGIPYICADVKKHVYTTDELRNFFVSCGIHCYNAEDNVIYCGEGFLAVHSVREGEIIINLPQKYRVKPLFGAYIPECETDTVKLIMEKHGTAIFELV